MVKPDSMNTGGLCLSIVLCVFVGPVFGQDDAKSVPARPSHIDFQVTAAGSQRYAPGHWGLLESQVRNSGDSLETVRGLAWFDTDPALQFGRDVIVPPQSVRRSWFLVRGPDADSSVRSMELTYGLAAATPGEEPAGTQETTSKGLFVPRSRPRVLFVNDTGPEEVQAYDLISSVRQQASPQMLLLDVPTRRLPPVEEAWDIADAVILTGDRIAHDTLAQTALLGWVRRGGSLWIPLDLIDHRIVQEMFADRLKLDVINRSSLNQFQIVPTAGSAEAPSPELLVETPVDLVRVVVDGAEVSHTIDGWPAAFHLQFGRGHVTFTAIGAGGLFVQPHQFVDQSLVAPGEGIRFTNAASSVFQRVFGRVRTESFSAETLDQYVTSRIGYETPQRSIVGLLLGLHVVLSLVVMRVLHRRDRPGWVLWSCPVLAIVAAGLLVGAGSASRSAPPGQQIFQFVEAETGRSVATVEGTLAVYSDVDFSPRLGTETGAVFVPDRRAMQQARWRLIRSDLNRWHSEGIQLRPGVRTAPFKSRITLDRPLRAVGTLDANGLSGYLESPLALAPQDALIASRTHVTLPVDITADGRIETSGAVLPPGQFLNASVVSAEQTRRQEVLREMFRADGRSSLNVTRPSLLFWTRPLDLKSGDLDAEAADGAALFMLPLEVIRPPAGSAVRVPSPLITYRAVPTAGSHATPAFFSNSQGTWSEYPRAGTITLLFQLPTELLPLEADSAVVTLKITAASRDVTVRGVSRADAAGEFSSPVGVREVKLDSAQFDVNETGGIPIQVSVGAAASESDADAPMQDRYWKMDWVQFEFRGRTR